MYKYQYQTMLFMWNFIILTAVKVAEKTLPWRCFWSNIQEAYKLTNPGSQIFKVKLTPSAGIPACHVFELPDCRNNHMCVVIQTLFCFFEKNKTLLWSRKCELHVLPTQVTGFSTFIVRLLY